MPDCSGAELEIHCAELSKSPNALCLSLHIFQNRKADFFLTWTAPDKRW